MQWVPIRRLFSPNFELYRDRVMRTLRPFTERMEIYSIDEAFTLLPLAGSAARRICRLRPTVWMLGLPVWRRRKPIEKKSLMIRKHSIGSLLVWSSALLPLLLWLLTESAEPRGRRFYSNANIVNAGQLAGLVGMAMLSIAFVLSSRARLLEDYFGGLDKMYRLHHRLGQTAFVLLLIHPIAHALRFVPDRFGSAL
ncbi:MAG: ferric reductase-like transmembrane domain-containing protein, partial [Rhodospirillales bacterium]